MSSRRVEAEYLIGLLSAGIKEEMPPLPPPGMDWHSLYSLAASHHVANIAYYGILKRGDLSLGKGVVDGFQRSWRLAIARETRQGFEVQQILRAFDGNGISCLPLKGWVMRDLYPSRDMRTMGDVDILIGDHFREKAAQALMELGYEPKIRGSVHDVYHKKPTMNIEIHRQLFTSGMYDGYFLDGWTKFQRVNQHQYQMTNEDFYIYLMAHLHKHYSNGGTGIRSILDIWIFLEHHERTLDRSYVSKEFCKLSLFEFAARMEKLAVGWFGKTSKDISGSVEESYILSSGVYGTMGHWIYNHLSKGEGSIGVRRRNYILDRLFLSRNQMVLSYPILERLPLLLPLFWFIRGTKAILFNRSKLAKELKLLYRR